MRPEPKIIAIDPGTMTGFCLRQRENSYAHGQMPWREFLTWLSQFGDDEIEGMVVERFVITAGTLRKTHAGIHDALNCIGALEWFSLDRGWRLVYQAPSDKNRVDNERLREYGLWTKASVHANDAARHMALAEIRLGLRK